MKRIVAAAALAAFVFLAGRARAEPSPGSQGPLLPVLLNVFPGLGIGSFVQGDRRGGFTALAGEAIGGGLLMAGASLGYANLLGLMFSGMSGEANGASEGAMEAGKWMAIGGFAIWAGTKVYGIVRPIAFARRERAKRGLAAWMAPSLAPAAAGGLASPALVLFLAY